MVNCNYCRKQSLTFTNPPTPTPTHLAHIFDNLWPPLPSLGGVLFWTDPNMVSHLLCGAICEQPGPRSVFTYYRWRGAGVERRRGGAREGVLSKKSCPSFSLSASFSYYQSLTKQARTFFTIKMPSIRQMLQRRL